MFDLSATTSVNVESKAPVLSMYTLYKSFAILEGWSNLGDLVDEISGASLDELPQFLAHRCNRIRECAAYRMSELKHIHEHALVGVRISAGL